ncbi:Sterol regulatory element-binding protein like [Argiope bruennichi]|uniref:Sterol regulatory element-binding protein cleavage-activating protein n=1 Tax=Argiope bruennichi TaxID=94029 RepID=A0A8T0FVA3_ARGBR|nr:Sterol regulatory element-binding protein like [Argiope bruennichi]
MDSTFRTKSYTADIHDKVARIYYSHGLFCSSHPYSVILVTVCILALCCYPILYLPLLGSSSQQFSTPVQSFVPPDIVLDDGENYKFTGPRWFQGPPVSYIQHIVVKSAVSPWKSDLILIDAFRAPLSIAFQINEILRNHQINQGTANHTSLEDLCLQVSEPIDKQTIDVLPSYGCLIISPSNLWKNDLLRFKNDPDIIKTIFAGKYSTDPASFREVLFGVPFKETGIKKLFMRNRPRIITYAFTVAFQTYNANYLKSLSEYVKSRFENYPYPENVSFNFEDSNIVHIQFQDLHTLVEFVPLVIAYVVLFLYIYFSVYKIELVKSKWILAISAVLTVVMSLLMSVGLCLWFGLSPTLSGSEILPYLIVVIGLENMLVLTKSVVSTPIHLDVKLRVAQGLSKEGWSITKNLLTELALLMIAFLTFVPKIQEFCLFAVVGLLTDFFLQLVFFATVLSVDIRRMEVTDLQRNCIREVTGVRSNQFSRVNEEQNSRNPPQARLMPVSGGYNGALKSTNYATKIFAPPATPMLVKLPKRMKFIYFWARTRMVQRGLMVCLVMWIFLLVYSSGLVEKYTGSSNIVNNQVINPLISSISQKINASFPAPSEEPENKLWNCTDQIVKEFARNIDIRLKHHNLNVWQSLPPQHWTNLFGYYNISLSGRFISILPPLHISVAVDPNDVVELRNPADLEISRKSYWQFLSSGEIKDGDIDDLLSRDLPYHPSSPGEVAIAIALAVPSLLFFVYLMVVLYRCMCSKHYAEWRTSWKNSTGLESNRAGYSESAADANLVMETFPLKLCGHSQDLEYLCADDNTVVSSCLDGNISVWDAISGECHISIRRSNAKLQKSSSLKNNDSFSSDSTYSSSPQSDVVIIRFALSHDNSLTYSNCEGVEYHDNHSVAHEYQSSRDTNLEYTEKGTKVVHSSLSHQAIWSLDYFGSCIAVGCKDGRIELWNAFLGKLEYVYEECKMGVTAVCLTSDRLIAARVSGLLEFFAIDKFINETLPSHLSHAGHAVPDFQSFTGSESIRCSWIQNIKAHSMTISVLEVDGSLVVSGGYDRLVKVFRSDSAVCIYNLHGHTAPISVLNIDQFSPSSAASGCQDGLICLWDLMTGTCMYSLNGHHGTVMSLLSTDIYMISQGTDNHICIWEKSQGHLLHSISLDFNLHSNIMLLTNNIMVTAKEDNLVLWDVIW